MLKKIFAIASLLCVIPMMANAGTKWTLGTRAMSQGGSITSRNLATPQVVQNGGIFKAYTTANVTVAVNPAAGFKIASISQNGIITENPAAGTVYTRGANTGNMSITATFVRTSFALTGIAGAGGTVNKTSYAPVYTGLQSPAKTFIFTPLLGQNVSAITVPGATLNTHYQLFNAMTNKLVTLPAAAGVKVKVSVTNVPGANLTITATFGGTATPLPAVASANCESCHVTQGVGAGVYVAWSSSKHRNAFHQADCNDCHIGASTGAHPGADPKQACATCHTGPFGYFAGAPVLAADVASCEGCHSTGNGIHSANTPTQTSCVVCHDVAIKHVKGGNGGVRPIMAEFQRNSHHISSGTPTDAQCAMCHLEGMASGAAIVPNPAFHLNGGVINLRSGNAAITADVAWDKEAPNHTGMDNFCMSCHNALGAAKAITELGTAKPAGATATSPFGIPVTNGYDTLVRPAVVPVYEQFDTNNVAHHAVRGAKYSVRTRTAAFSANSSAALPGVRKTIYDAGLFVATYTPLGDTLSVADNSVLHCGDCHTVGQFKAGSTTNAKGVATTQVIGAHGSVNEYMLRTATGVDELHHQSNNASAVAAEELPGHTEENMLGADGTYVCFLCHAQTLGETGGYNAMGFHGGMEGANSSYCNGRAAESVGLTGFGGKLTVDAATGLVRGAQTRVPNIAAGNAGGNVFGYSCAHCHNAGQNNTFGGIHGGNTSYKSYSGAGTTTNIVTKKPFRFMGGLSLRYNGGGDDSTRWENNAKFSTSRREGCYNQSTVVKVASAPTATLWGPGTRTGDDTPVQPNGTNGTWGSCSHHSGVTTSGSGTQPTRVGVTRPLKY